VKEKSRLRMLIHNCNEASTKAFQEEETAEDIAIELQNNARKMIGSIGGGLHTGIDAVSHSYTQITARNADKRRVTGIPCGIKALDELTTGFQNGDLVILSAKTGHGKTALALNAMSHAMMHFGKKPIIFSLEMSHQQLCTRIISAHSGVDSYHLRTGFVANVEWSQVGAAAARLSECKFWIHDKSITIQELDSTARRIHDEHGIDFLVVDYLQLVTLGGKRRVENRTQEVTEVSRGLKAIATALNIPVIALSQVNVDGEVRESRAIEHDASLFIYIDMDTDELQKMDIVPAKIHLKKNRNGSLGTVDCVFHKRITKFV